eukprot:4682082-Amphidinium_carterae.1
MARLGLVVLDENTPQGLKVEIDLSAMNAKNVFRGLLALVMVRGAAATEQNDTDQRANEAAWLVTVGVL